MKQLLARFTLPVMTALGAGVGIYVAMNWATMPFLQRMVGLFFFALILHVWEEMRFPGGFAEMVTSRLKFTLMDHRLAESIVAAYILYLAFVPLFFPNLVWMSVAAMLLALAEPFFHLVAIKVFERKHFYSPGLITALLFHLPIGIMGISYVVQNDLMRPWEWAFSLIYMAIGLAIAQGTAVRMSGLKYSEFLKKAKAALFA